jgi:hypothetical protein
MFGRAMHANGDSALIDDAALRGHSDSRSAPMGYGWAKVKDGAVVKHQPVIFRHHDSIPASHARFCSTPGEFGIVCH